MEKLIEQSLKTSENLSFRDSDRAFFTVAVTVEIGDHIIQCAQCQNISLTGMLINVKEIIEDGTTGTVTLTKRCALRRYSFSADFEAIRVEKIKGGTYNIGIKFVHMYEEDQKVLAHIVNYHISLLMRKKIEIDETKLNGVIFKIAQTKEELEQAYKIVHDSYVSKGYCDSQPHGMKLSIYNSFPFTTTLVGKLKDEVIITCTIFLDSFINLPMDQSFGEHLFEFRNNQRLILEVGSFAIKAGTKIHNNNINIHLHKMVMNYCEDYLGADDLLLTVNPRHRMYYQHIWCADPIGPVKALPQVKGNPAVLMHINLRACKARMQGEYSGLPLKNSFYNFLYTVDSKSIVLPEKREPLMVLNKELLHYFFEERTTIFSDTNKETVKKILRYYV